jgi:hypothetical protein
MAVLNKPRITRALPPDAVRLVDLYPDATFDEVCAWLQGGFEMFTYCADERVIGAVRLSFPTGAGFIDRFSVRVEADWTDVGGPLLEHAIARAYTLGMSRVWVVVGDSAETRSLCRLRGFVETDAAFGLMELRI